MNSRHSIICLHGTDSRYLKLSNMTVRQTQGRVSSFPHAGTHAMRYLLSLVLLLVLPFSTLAADAVPPASNVPFTIQLRNGRSVEATILQVSDSSFYFVYSLDGRLITGQLGFGAMPVPPTPGPGPNPGPGPTPTPITEIIQIKGLVVEETADRTINSNSIYAGKEINAYLLASGNTLKRIDPNIKDENRQTPKDLEPFLSIAAKNKLPYLFLQGVTRDNKRKDLYSGPGPITEAELIAMFKKYGGK